MTDRANCPKHVEFYSKNKFENWVHLVGFIIRTGIQTMHLYWRRIMGYSVHNELKMSGKADLSQNLNGIAEEN